jgi:hypothetical protein
MRLLRGSLNGDHGDHENYDAEAAELVRHTLRTAADALPVDPAPVRPRPTRAARDPRLRPGPRLLAAIAAGAAAVAGGLSLVGPTVGGVRSGPEPAVVAGNGDPDETSGPEASRQSRQPEATEPSDPSPQSSPSDTSPGSAPVLPSDPTAPSRVPDDATRTSGTVAGVPYDLTTWRRGGSVPSTCWRLRVAGALAPGAAGRGCVEDVPIERMSVSLVTVVDRTPRTTVFWVVHAPDVTLQADGAVVVQPDVQPGAGTAFSLVGVEPDSAEVTLSLGTTDGWDLGGTGPLPVDAPPGSLVWRGVDGSSG